MKKSLKCFLKHFIYFLIFFIFIVCAEAYNPDEEEDDADSRVCN